MALLFRTSFCLLTVLFYSTSHCVAIETVGEKFDWKYGSLIEHTGLRAPRPFLGNILQLCRTSSKIHNDKLTCLLCKGFDISCLISTTTSTPSTTALPQTTTSTLSTTTPGLTTTTPSISTSTPAVSTTTPSLTSTTTVLTTTTPGLTTTAPTTPEGPSGE